MRAAYDVIRREQHLAHRAVVASKRRRVARQQQALADTRRGLLRSEIARTLLQPERFEPGGNRAGRDEHDLRPRAEPCCDRVDEGVNAVAVETT